MDVDYCHCLNMFRASLCPSSGEKTTCYCIWSVFAVTRKDADISRVVFCRDSVWFGPPLWSTDQSFWLQIQRTRIRSPALPDFLSSSGSGTGSTQPREVKLRSYLNKKVAAPGSEKRD